MVRNPFTEEWQSIRAYFLTLWGGIAKVAQILAGGYILVNLNPAIIAFWVSVLPDIQPLLWAAVDITYTFIGLSIVWVVVKFLKASKVKNRGNA